MSINVAKRRREDLLAKLNNVRSFIAMTSDDENKEKQLQGYINEIERELRGKKYGLLFEEHCERIDEVLENSVPFFAEEKSLYVDNGGQVNFILEGDNLASLRLLEKTSREKIDLIIIDPPYNRGKNDFVYDDDF